MRSTNKVAKYVAIALGLILAIFIISVIVKTTLGIFGAYGLFKHPVGFSEAASHRDHP